MSARLARPGQRGPARQRTRHSASQLADTTSATGPQTGPHGSREVAMSADVVSLPALRGSEAGTVVLSVNGQERELRMEPRVSLLDALREHLGLTGSKKG